MAETPLTLTTALGIVYNNNLPFIRGIINFLFPSVYLSPTQQIRVDRFIDDLEQMSYSPHGGSSDTGQAKGGSATHYIPPELKIKVPIDNDGWAAGVPINAPQSQHQTVKVAREQQRNANKIIVTSAIQALSVMREASFDALTMDGQKVGEFNFNRDSSLDLSTYDTSVSGAFKALSALWAPLEDFYTPSAGLFAIVGKNLMAAIEEDPLFVDATKNIQFQIFADRQAGQPMNGNEIITQMCRVKIPGTTKYITLLTIDKVYKDLTGNKVPFMPANEMIMSTTQSPRTAAYGAVNIANKSTGNVDIIQGEMITDALLQDDPAGKFVRTQSFPLMIPSDINNCGRLIATDLPAT
jgi:hypothetical protein